MAIFCDSLTMAMRREPLVRNSQKFVICQLSFSFCSDWTFEQQIKKTNLCNKDGTAHECKSELMRFSVEYFKMHSRHCAEVNFNILACFLYNEYKIFLLFYCDMREIFFIYVKIRLDKFAFVDCFFYLKAQLNWLLY